MYYHRLLSQKRAKSYMGALSTTLVILCPLTIGLQEDQSVKLIVCCHTVRELSFWVIKNGTYHRIVIINVHRTMSRHQNFLESEYLGVVCYSSTSPHSDTHILGNPPRSHVTKPGAAIFLEICIVWLLKALRQRRTYLSIAYHWYGLTEAVKRTEQAATRFLVAISKADLTESTLNNDRNCSTKSGALKCGKFLYKRRQLLEEENRVARASEGRWDHLIDTRPYALTIDTPIPGLATPIQCAC